MQPYGEVQTNYMGSLQQGVLSATYFDLRAAAMAKQQLDGKMLGSCQLEVTFAKAPKSSPQLEQVCSYGVVVAIVMNYTCARCTGCALACCTTLVAH